MPLGAERHAIGANDAGPHAIGIARRAASRLVRVVCGVIALAAVVGGLAAHAFGDAVAIGDEARAVIAGGLGLLGALYAGVLFWWDRRPFGR